MVVGKLLLAISLGVVALGILLRLTSPRAGVTAPPPPAPDWVFAVSAGLSVVEVAALVEATSLPVRFDQEDFALHHWALVLLALLAAYLLQLAPLKALAARRRMGARHERGAR